MFTVKAEVYKGLKNKLQTLNVSVFDYYPENLESFPLVIYLEENNTPHEIVDAEETASKVKYRVDIWAKEGTTDLALAVNEVFFNFGMERIQSTDAPDVSGLRHKTLRFEGIVDKYTRLVYRQ